MLERPFSLNRSFLKKKYSLAIFVSSEVENNRHIQAAIIKKMKVVLQNSV